MSQLKPLSDLDREMLDAIGETPSNFQQAVQRILNKPLTKATSTKENVHTINNRVERKLTYSEPTKELVEKMQEATFVPCAYVIFIRKWMCSCGSSGECLEYPGLFLQEKPLKKVKDQSNPFRYLPVKELAYPHLPRYKEIVIRGQYMCEYCFDEEAEIYTASAGLSIHTLTEIIRGLPNVKEPQEDHFTVSKDTRGSLSPNVLAPA